MITSSSRYIAALGAATLLATLTACSASEPNTTAAGRPAETVASASAFGPHNDADVEFAQMVIVHSGALAIARLAAERSSDPDTKGLAESILTARAAEIDVMTSWLQAWGAEVPEIGSMPESDRDAPMPGLVTDQQVADLDDASGPAFDRQFLSLMIEHHTSSIARADVEARSGESILARHFAATITGDQGAELAEMKSILRR
ncbi:DUF305 domain-containing protein [Cryobacterium zhongshanensis]|uniref:DUF305 domain-containing protein n=1 Tax=Cryobacterium zhongshanensis TaxID=2928153 RepID=A0AA41UJ26_9MICO|nr:DUF305 domain-containing protein [Cryobacterium zhongshanensis]MCI4660189.1 DUF305 domain-containing protein [Cryobacterium zhongshanensis]